MSVPLAVFASNPHTKVAWGPKGNIGLDSLEVLDLAGDQGWATLETFLIRVNSSMDPLNRFPVYWGGVGYDAAVCVQRYESWIIETYNTSATSPSVLRIVGKGNGNPPLLPRGNIRGTPIENTRYLNMTGNSVLFRGSHGTAVVQMLRDTYLDEYFIPIGTVGPSVPLCTIFLLTLTYFTGCFSRRSWGLHPTISRQVCQYPRTV